jgi:hypothetical protein
VNSTVARSGGASSGSSPSARYEQAIAAMTAGTPIPLMTACTPIPLMTAPPTALPSGKPSEVIHDDYADPQPRRQAAG